MAKKLVPVREQELIALRLLITNQAWEVVCQGGFPASLIYVLILSPSPAVASTFVPLPSRNTSPRRPVHLPALSADAHRDNRMP